jgi:predicted RNA-binding protein YlxR (DUF448 family)
VDLPEAKKVVESAFPGQKVDISQSIPGRGAYVIRVDDEILGRDFDLLKACRAACMPVLEKARRDHADNEQAKILLYRQFGKFLEEKFKEEFAAWLEEQTAPGPDETPPPAP